MNLSDQSRAPIFEALERYKSMRIVPFDVPGHKRGKGNPELTKFLGEKCLTVDVNSMKPLDNLCHPVSVIKEAEELAARAFGAQHAFFMVNGTTSAVQSMIMSVCKRGDKIIMPRNVHRSAINALRLGNWDYSSDYYYPNEMNPETLFAEENDQPLSAAEDVLAVLLQDYYGSENADYGVDYVEVRGRARKRVGRTKNDLGAYKKDYPKGTYYISFRQKLEGIPIYLEIGHKMLTTNQTHITQEVALKCQRISGIETNTLEYMDETSFILDTTWMGEEKRIQEDVPLATLDEVIQALEKKIEEGYIRDIYALRLGYVCYPDDISPDIYALYPAWICDCIYANSPREQIMKNIVTDAFRENFRYEQIVVDAQTCDIQAGWIDRDEGLYHAEPMTWGKMQ